MRKRYVYRLDLNQRRPSASALPLDTSRTVRPARENTDDLSQLMIDAYRGTIDYDGETLDDAMAEVQGFFDGRDVSPLLDCSNLTYSGSKLVSACLVGWWNEKQSPLIAYLMTHANWKNRGLGGNALERALVDLSDQGHPHVYAVITEGNLPSELLHERAGFVRWEA